MIQDKDVEYRTPEAGYRVKDLERRINYTGYKIQFTRCTRCRRYETWMLHGA
jgi:hypothetical protein